MDHTTSLAIVDVSDEDLALNSAVTYPIIPAMQSTALKIKKTNQILRCGDARELDWIPDQSVHLVVTSPPYWTLKEYPKHKGQLGFISDYEQFHDELDRVWRHCLRVLVPGGRIVCVVGDVCLCQTGWSPHGYAPARRYCVRCHGIGFDNLTPILWCKNSDAKYEIESGRAGFLENRTNQMPSLKTISSLF